MQKRLGPIAGIVQASVLKSASPPDIGWSVCDKLRVGATPGWIGYGLALWRAWMVGGSLARPGSATPAYCRCFAWFYAVKAMNLDLEENTPKRVFGRSETSLRHSVSVYLVQQGVRGLRGDVPPSGDNRGQALLGTDRNPSSKASAEGGTVRKTPVWSRTIERGCSISWTSPNSASLSRKRPAKSFRGRRWGRLRQAGP